MSRSNVAHRSRSLSPSGPIGVDLLFPMRDASSNAPPQAYRRRGVGRPSRRTARGQGRARGGARALPVVRRGFLGCPSLCGLN